MKRSFLAILALSLIATTPTTVEAQSHAPILDEEGEEIIATFSIVARDPVTEELGIAVQSRAFRAAAIVSYAKAGVGAIATQASANQAYGPEGLALLEQGLSPEQVVRRLTAAGPGQDRRQLAIIGDRPQALATLSLAVDRNRQWGERALASDAFAGLRDDGEFRRLVGR